MAKCGVFLVAVTACADVLNIKMFWAKQNWVNVSLSVMILVLVTVVIADNVRVWFQLLKTRGPVGLNTGPEKGEPVLEVQD